MNFLNPLFDCDSYKASQWLMMPPNTTNVYSYFESRLGGNSPFKKTVFFGLQYLIKNVFLKPITMADVEYANSLYNEHMGIFNYEGWKYIVENHNGYLPLEIKAIPEGTVIERSNALYTIENTDPNCFWVTQWIETIMVRLWYSINVATLSYYTKQRLIEFLKISSDKDPQSEVLFKMHCFGARGSASSEASMIGGLAHLTSFMGTDNVTSLLCAKEVYNTNEMVGFSVIAGEHSNYTSWGVEREKDSYENVIDTFGGKNPIFAMVVDSFDMENAIKNIIGVQLKDKIINSGSTFTLRLDSGIPVESVMNALNWLTESFGYTVNSKGYKVLPDYIRILQGDGINYDSIGEICQTMIDNQYSIDCIIFGQGGGILQQHDRDTLRFAQKCSSIVVDGVEKDVRKIPKSDMTKASKGGRLAVVKASNGSYMTTTQKHCKENGFADYLKTVYYHQGNNIPTTHQYTFNEVRANTLV